MTRLLLSHREKEKIRYGLLSEPFLSKVILVARLNVESQYSVCKHMPHTEPYYLLQIDLYTNLPPPKDVGLNIPSTMNFSLYIVAISST